MHIDDYTKKMNTTGVTEDDARKLVQKYLINEPAANQRRMVALRVAITLAIAAIIALLITSF